MNHKNLLAIALLLLACGSAPAESTAPAKLSPADEAAVFEAAGFRLEGSDWHSCDHGDSEAAYVPGEIAELRDLNGDGRPEAIVTEHSAFCYGMVGTAFTVVSREADGRWSAVVGERGIPDFLATRGADGWPDLQLGGPGFCFPVLRWNGKTYALHRHEYEGKACEQR